MQIEEVFTLQMKFNLEFCTDQRTICRLKNYLQIEVQFADQRIISKSNNNLQIQFRSADRRILDELIKALSANQSSIYR